MVMVEVLDWRNFLMGFLKRAAVVRLVLFEKCGDEAGIYVPARARASESGGTIISRVLCWKDQNAVSVEAPVINDAQVGRSSQHFGNVE
jgi:hypothetical protein